MNALKKQFQDYLVAHRLEDKVLTDADAILIYLRINTPLSLRKAEMIMGKPITRCPPAIPPWPPKPVETKCKVRRVLRVKKNDFRPSMASRFKYVRPNMTRQQLILRGCSTRDLCQWTRTGHITWSGGL